MNASKIEYLSLAANHFKNFPDTLCGLQSLKTLILNSNHLNAVPEKCDLPALTFLRLSDNRYTRIPESLTTITTLVSLDISKNYIDATNATSTTWPALDSLNLFHNNFDCHKIDNAFRTTRIVTCLPLSQKKRTVPNSDWGVATTATIAILCVLGFALIIAAIVVIVVVMSKKKHGEGEYAALVQH